ncbi:Spo0B domain-containing protein [Oceanobacillus halotolerans]|uniref:Spo0B domain-containing protein n=1 Tax=Oceanobacillus halotolerans TaxID=2663380 RepID=UPI0013DA8C8B|nr:Spo0B domain-containing protein [Oceanobacillus halotolerans]
MEEQEVIHLIRHYRHDILNHLQVIQGYVKMGKMDKVEAKLNQFMEDFQQERNLMQLNAPKIILWIMQFNTIHTNLRLTYHIDADHIDLSNWDSRIQKQCDDILHLIKNELDQTELYEVTLHVTKNSENQTVQFMFLINGCLQNTVHVKQMLSSINSFPIKVSEETNGVSFIVSIPLDK